ncbi:hypothetical protein CPB85DRAFT_274941 [Mucidula mucida]|nr:hypothetical protein CPB85DRAFT_274941 [Mucidula mucida]
MKNKCWQLGRICHWWRTIVEGSPSLWTRLAVHLAEAAMLRDPAALLRHALRLTKGQKLIVLLDFGTEILAAHAPCWQKLVLTHCSAACWYALSMTIGSTTLAKLETLAISDCSVDEDSDYEDEDEEDSDDEYDDWLPDAPLLERLAVHKALLEWSPLLPQLKGLAMLEAIANISLAYLLQTSSQLGILWVQQFDPDSESHLSVEILARVTSSSLHHLALHLNIEALETVDLPNVYTLKVGEIELAESATPYLQSIFNLVQFSHPPLTTLVLLNCDLAVGNLVGILKLLPLLKVFRIHFGDIVFVNGNVDRVLAALTSALGDVDKRTEVFTLVPDLEELRIDFYDFEEVAAASEWTFYTSKVEAGFGTRESRNGFTASCTFLGKPYFGDTLPGSYTG